MKAALAARCLILCVLLASLVPEAASARHNHPDADGRVPVTWLCRPGEAHLGWTKWRRVNREWEARVYVNRCRVYARGGNARDVIEVFRHEMAHAHGWEHHEGSPEENAAFSRSKIDRR